MVPELLQKQLGNHSSFFFIGLLICKNNLSLELQESPCEDLRMKPTQWEIRPGGGRKVGEERETGKETETIM